MKFLSKVKDDIINFRSKIENKIHLKRCEKKNMLKIITRLRYIKNTKIKMKSCKICHLLFEIKLYTMFILKQNSGNLVPLALKISFQFLPFFNST